MGAGDIAIPTLLALKHDLLNTRKLVRHLEVVQPFPPPYKSHASLREALAGLKIHQVDDPKTLKHWRFPISHDGEPFDIGVVVSFKYFLPSHVIQSLRLGVINLHPSLLPLYRGLSPSDARHTRL